MAQMIVILFIMSMGLVRSDDNVAMESNVHYQTAYKVHPDENDGQSFEKNSRDSQLSSQNHYYTVPQKLHYSNENLLKNDDDLKYGGVETQHNQHDLHQHSVPDNSGHLTITSSQNSQSLHGNHIHQEYANVPQALYLHQYPVQQNQVYGSQPSHFYQVEKDGHEGKTIGFSSFVEHFTPKDDDEELQSALKEGSVKDIKRLVPKSGISFKIYQDGKNWESNSENQKTGIQSHFQNYVTQNNVKPEPIFKDHRGQSKFRIEVPATHIKSHDFRQSQTHLDEPKQVYLSQTSESLPQQHQVSTLTKFSHEPHQVQQAQLAHEYHYTKPEENSQRQTPEITAKGSSGLDSSFQIRVKEDDYNHGQHGSNWNSPVPKVQVLHSKAHYQNNWKSAEGSNKVQGLSDSVKQLNIDPTAHEQFQQLRSYADIVVGKTIQNNFDHQKALEGSTSFDIKNAIGSTNALDHETHQTSTEIHKGASQVNPNEFQIDLGKPSLTYAVPNIQVHPTASLLIENSVHGASSGLQGEHHTKYIKDAISSTSELPRPVVSSPLVHDINGKYFSQPQTVQIWNSGHYGQGNTLTSNHLHQSLVAFPGVKDQEILQHLKTSSPQPSVTVLSASLHPQQQHYQQPHQQRAIGFHRDVSLTKYPQDIQFQYKKNPNFQVPHIRPIQLVSTTNPDLNLYKTKLPNINLNTIVMKPDLSQLFKESSGKKIIPILVKKRKNRSNKEVTGVVYGQTTTNRGVVTPKLRHDKTIRVNYLPESSQNINHYLPKNGDNNEFSVSASYKVDRSLLAQRD